VGGQATAKDLTITLNCCLAENPFEIIIITIHRDLKFVRQLAASISGKIKVLSIPKPNKRHQVAEGIRQTKTEIIVMCDNDMIWQRGLLPYLLAPFQRKEVGAVGPLQGIQRAPDLPIIERMWEYLGACYKERCTFETTAVSNIDGGVGCCLGGGTAAYRTWILNDEKFLEQYCSETWTGALLNADDDNFTTRRLIALGQEIAMQTAPQALIETTLLRDSKYLEQCLRWARSNWRSNITSCIYERYIWKKQPWTVYAVHLQTPMFPFITDPLLFYLLHRATQADGPLHYWSLWILGIWTLFSKLLKLIPYYLRYPQDLVFIPVTIVFGYVYGIIKLYALFTLSEVSDTAPIVRNELKRINRLLGAVETSKKKISWKRIVESWIIISHGWY
jgi:cellulose synthase/poly-beta-1,6-N-acetylglucosamine synthase-like glycosyltransferase